MKKTIWGMALGTAVLSSAALADVKEYIQAGYTMDQVLDYAIERDGMKLDKAMMKALDEAPQQADAIIAAAVAIDPDRAQELIDMAAAAGVDPEQAFTAALVGGADPSTISKPTAAGSSLAARRGAPENLPAPPWSNAGGVGNGPASDN
ncbi:hypothetical protein [Microbulbifer yueqingensis]|uniref:Uncharacterized protein n=1 Tax=Microbulbifer yueqingensis TaxID=658219 RepID=A0A1G8VP94_9GAMM|nr:hypothetical protein [Microbulbifer yueqingensis]SDJ67010.1 hypothetical protein SAMN05216212_0631 [Microbulbifer yueqingensis]